MEESLNSQQIIQHIARYNWAKFLWWTVQTSINVLCTDQHVSREYLKYDTYYYFIKIGIGKCDYYIMNILLGIFFESSSTSCVANMRVPTQLININWITFLSIWPILSNGERSHLWNRFNVSDFNITRSPFLYKNKF